MSICGKVCWCIVVVAVVGKNLHVGCTSLEFFPSSQPPERRLSMLELFSFFFSMLLLHRPSFAHLLVSVLVHHWYIVLSPSVSL